MKLGENYFEFGVKYGVPLVVIASTLAMKKAKGLGNLLVFAVVAPAMLAYVFSLSKAKGNIE
jgi:hypothetical protein